jgi:hypothetical protein
MIAGSDVGENLQLRLQPDHDRIRRDQPVVVAGELGLSAVCLQLGDRLLGN